MMSDARFEDGSERPVRLRAENAEDLAIISALVQDALGLTADASWMPRRHRFALLVNRFRWEDSESASRQGRPFERVRSLLVFDGVLRVRASGFDPGNRGLVLSLLSLAFDGGEDAGGTVRLMLAGDGEVALEVECIDVTLEDVTRPYVAPSGSRPRHPDD